MVEEADYETSQKPTNPINQLLKEMHSDWVHSLEFYLNKLSNQKEVEYGK